MSAIYEQIINAPRSVAASATVLLIDRLQDFIEQQKGVQVVAAAALFLLLAERFNVEPQDVFTATKNLMRQRDGDYAPQFKAVEMYLKNEVQG